MKKSDLINYLKTCINFEKEIYTLEDLVYDLDFKKRDLSLDIDDFNYNISESYNNINSLQQEKNNIKFQKENEVVEEYQYTDTSKLEHDLKTWYKICVVLALAFLIIPSFKIKLLTILSFIIIFLVGLISISSINNIKKQIKMQNKINLKRQYQQTKHNITGTYDRFNHEIDMKINEEQKKINNYNIKIENNKIQINTLDIYKNTVSDRIIELNKQLQSYYSLDIIYKSYRGLLPLSYFCSYLESNRCNTLIECMNKYDDDLHFERLYSKLDDVENSISNKLEEINIRLGNMSNQIENMGELICNKLDAIEFAIYDAEENEKKIMNNVNNNLKLILENQKYTNDVEYQKSLKLDDINNRLCDLQSWEYYKALL